MFAEACNRVRPSLFGVAAISIVDEKRVLTKGTAFAVRTDLVVTAAHVLHEKSDVTKPLSKQIILFQVAGKEGRKATVVREDIDADIALLQVEGGGLKPVELISKTIPAGTSCGSLGYPLAKGKWGEKGAVVSFIERFQSGCVSANHPIRFPTAVEHPVYECDYHMYVASSGSPAFLPDGKVFAMHTASVTDRETDEAKRLSQHLAISLWVPAEDIMKLMKKAA